MKLVVGLGNPGREYDRTRHNVGFMAVDRIVDSFGLKFDKSKFNGLYTIANIDGFKVIFLKPQEYMNLSGNVIRRFKDFYDVDVSDILIIHDDLDMAVGKIKLRQKGSSGGHNGLKNIEANLGTQNYKRIKVGISKDSSCDIKDYVLGKFSFDDMNIIDDILNKMPALFNDYLNLSFEMLMNKYN